MDVSVAADHIIDTLNATENEPLLSQKFNLTISHYGEGPPAYNSQKTLSYDSIIYADYTSSPDAVVEVFVDLNGVNEWWQGGSGFNRYHDRLGTTFKGEKHGWVSVTGELAEGEGFRSIPQALDSMNFSRYNFQTGFTGSTGWEKNYPVSCFPVDSTSSLISMFFMIRRYFWIFSRPSIHFSFVR